MADCGQTRWDQSAGRRRGEGGSESGGADEGIRACVRGASLPIVKDLFRHRKVRYCGLAKNGHQLYVFFGLANAVIEARAEDGVKINEPSRCCDKKDRRKRHNLV